MALKLSLTFVTRRLAEAVRTATAKLGLGPDDYALAGTFDNHSDRISLTIGIDRTADERKLYAETLAEIRKRFPEFPQITMWIGLVIQKVNSLEEFYLGLASPEDEMDLTELLQRN